MPCAALGAAPRAIRWEDCIASHAYGKVPADAAALKALALCVSTSRIGSDSMPGLMVSKKANAVCS
jgi:hypothetical protein